MSVTAEIARRPMRTVRPKDLAAGTVNPRAAIDHHVRTGRALRLAPGFTMLRPDNQRDEWTPTLEETAAAIGVALVGPDDAVLVGLTAARLHGALPRAIGEAFVALPYQHRPIIDWRGRTIQFIKRNVGRLEARPFALTPGKVLVATAEQTALDLARLAGRAQVRPEVHEALAGLVPQLDWTKTHRLAREQHGYGAALSRLNRIAQQ